MPKIKEKSTKLLAVTIILAIVVHIVCLVLNVFILKNILDFSAASFGILIIYVLGALAGSIFFIGVVSKVKKLKFLEYVGKNSLVYYGLHYEVLAIVSFVTSKLTNIDLLMTAISFILTVCFTTMIVWIYNKLNIGKLFK